MEHVGIRILMTANKREFGQVINFRGGLVGLHKWDRENVLRCGRQATSTDHK